MFKINRVGVFLVPLLASCGQATVNESLSLEVKNSSVGGEGKQVIEIQVPEKYSGWKLKNNVSEWITKDTGEKVLLGAVAVSPGTTEQLTLVPPSVSVADITTNESGDRAHAELSVRTGGEWEGKAYKADGFSFEEVASFTSPEQLTDHSYYLRYEGPGWESDRMGYRLYLDWRNAIDVFVKTGDAVVLPQAGQDGYDSYHTLSEWGGDALKVGKSLGVGALGRNTDNGVLHFQHVASTQYKLVSNTDLRAEFDVEYTGWALDENGAGAIDVSTRYRIDAFDPTTHISVSLSKPTDDLVTGLVAHEGMSVINTTQGDWGVIATWGEQSILAEGDQLGLAVFYRVDQVSEVAKAAHDHLVTFKPATNIDYKILALWPRRDEHITSAADFENYLVNKLKAFNHPVSVEQHAN